MLNPGLNAVGIRLDPFPAFNFNIVLIDSSSVAAGIASGIRATLTAGFSECSGLDVSMQPFEVQEGGLNTHTHKLVGPMSYSNITLKRGMTLSDDLWNWHEAFLRGRGARRDGLIVLLAEDKAPAKLWVFREGMPVHWTGPSLNAAQGAIAIEQLEIAHHGIVLVTPGAALGAAGFSI